MLISALPHVNSVASGPNFSSVDTELYPSEVLNEHKTVSSVEEVAKVEGLTWCVRKGVGSAVCCACNLTVLTQAGYLTSLGLCGECSETLPVLGT